MRLTLLALALLVACQHGRPQPEPPPGQKLCGGIAGRTCGPTEYCNFANNQCGAGDQSGLCKPRPDACTLIAGPPVCACDGKTYQNECQVYVAGSDLNVRGSCDVPSGSFVCGYLQCTVQTQYCLHEHDASGADRYSCALLPACGTQPETCTCLANERCGSACTGSATAGLTLTCM